MFMRQLLTAALLTAVLASAGCHCCKGTRASYPPPCCGGAPGPIVPGGPVAVPAAPAPVSAGFATGAPCPTCMGQ